MENGSNIIGSIILFSVIFGGFSSYYILARGGTFTLLAVITIILAISLIFILFVSKIGPLGTVVGICMGIVDITIVLFALIMTAEVIIITIPMIFLNGIAIYAFSLILRKVLRNTVKKEMPVQQ